MIRRSLQELLIVSKARFELVCPVPKPLSLYHSLLSSPIPPPLTNIQGFGASRTKGDQYEVIITGIHRSIIIMLLTV